MTLSILSAIRGEKAASAGADKNPSTSARENTIADILFRIRIFASQSNRSSKESNSTANYERINAVVAGLRRRFGDIHDAYRGDKCLVIGNGGDGIFARLVKLYADFAVLIGDKCGLFTVYGDDSAFNGKCYGVPVFVVARTGK